MPGPGPGPGPVHVEIGETQRLLNQIVDEDLRAKMLAARGEVAQPGEHLQMRRGTDRTLESPRAASE